MQNKKLLLSSLTALSPLDGRYLGKMGDLHRHFSEFGLIYYRLMIEMEWLKALANNPEIPEVPPFSEATINLFNFTLENFNEAQAEQIKAIEKITNHDVKAVEYWLRERFADNPEVGKVLEFIYFGLTSEDVNCTSYALMLKKGAKILTDSLQKNIQSLREKAHAYADIPMMSLTHGQPATPTTVGKEFANFAKRLFVASDNISRVLFQTKWSGASGNYNAFMVSHPDIDWQRFCANFIKGLGLEYNHYTTQIEPHDYMARLFNAIAEANTILIGLDRDIWGYISRHYFKLKVIAGEVGSSTMPHKVNPLDFENSEGNFGMANAILRFMAEKLPISRFQRDLSDSTVLRNMGVALGYTLLAYESCLKGLGKLEVNEIAIAADLDNAWELLAEPMQTIMRKHNVENAYDKLKELTRGKDGITTETLRPFILGLDIPDAAKLELFALTPANYTGKAAELARSV